MIRLVRAALAAALAFAAPLAPAQTVPPPAAAPAPAPDAGAARIDARPALWVVRDADTTIYLFGTVHLLRPEIDWFKGRVKTAFDASDELILEVVEPNAPELQQMMASLAVNPGGPPLSSQLSPEGKANYEAALQALNLPVAAIDLLDPWAAALVIQMGVIEKMGLDAPSGVETVLTAEAKARGKTVGELETAEQQLRMMDDMPHAVQIALLESTVKSLAEIEATTDAMIRHWTEGDADALAALMNATLDETPELHRIMLADRNARWADWIARRLDKPGTVFVAVGAGHLAGRDSVQDLLARRKLTVVAVDPAPEDGGTGAGTGR